MNFSDDVKSLHVVHCVPFKFAFSNGIQAAVWRLAQAQSGLGCEVTILSLGRAPHPEEVERAGMENVRLVGIPKRALFREEMSDQLRRIMEPAREILFHLHSVFIPQHTYVGHQLLRKQIPYCAQPHGNLLAEELGRKSLRKRAYLQMFESRYLKGAQRLLAVSEREKSSLMKMFPRGRIELLPNAVELNISTVGSGLPGVAPRGIFLGKKDVFHKGLDRIFSVAERAELNVDLHLIEHPQAELNEEFKRLCARGVPPTINLLPPVYGEDKQEALSRHDFYIHASRWEVYGISILEAMLSGKPVILSRECDLAGYVDAHRLGLVIDFESKTAPGKVAAFLRDPAEMIACGSRARDWALEHAGPRRVAQRSLAIYRNIMRDRDRS